AGYGALLGAAAVLTPTLTVVAAGGTVLTYLPWALIAAVILVPVPLVAGAAFLLRPPSAARVVASD
ncbi:MAG: hypothetical protein Q4F67_17215, partial [Propionibacteriaceae bacterium]|nr:hypothetical protein [Propionibacteriaceae bacterium]